MRFSQPGPGEICQITSYRVFIIEGVGYLLGKALGFYAGGLYNQHRTELGDVGDEWYESFAFSRGFGLVARPFVFLGVTEDKGFRQAR